MANQEAGEPGGDLLRSLIIAILEPGPGGVHFWDGGINFVNLTGLYAFSGEGADGAGRAGTK
ncbi:hypothetical protein B2K_39850 [Paenibacillus mucilaginosus K02]|uniref:Uncharacterized protein n=1 Tax=Paenibacillus mucilaginosus K02 TaxID=997761 RepID=R9ULM3_9BACL|nr:hypothetical protein B2K_39850 [Paenibacillus mucilaginosus K02]